MEGFRRAVFELLLGLFLFVVVVSAAFYAPIAFLRRLPLRVQRLNGLVRISLAAVLVMAIQ